MKESRQRLLDTLRDSESTRASITATARGLQQAALSMQDKLNDALPDLARKAESAEGEVRQQAYTHYLTAKQNLHRCEQAYQRARRQEAIAESL